MADVVIAQARVAANTSTGNQDITTPDLGGRTPKAVLFYVVGATGDGEFNHAHICIGAASGASERWCAAANSESGSADTDNARTFDSDEVIRVNNVGSTGVNGEADFVSFITNGVRINWGNALNTAYQIVAVFFAGDDVEEAHAGVFDLTDGEVITAPGFTANLIFAIATNQTAGNAGSDFNIGHGWQDGQSSPDAAAQCLGEENGESSGSPSMRATGNDTSILAINESNGTIDHDGFFDTFTASGFTYRAVDDDDSDQAGYLALRIAGASVKVGLIDSPTSTGNWSVTGVGFKPQAVFIGMNMVTARDSAVTGSPAGTAGYSIVTENGENALSVQIESGPATTDTQSSLENEAIFLPEDDGADGFAGTFVSFDSDGWTYDIDDVPNSTARKWFYLAIESAEDDAQGQVSWAELEAPDEAGQGQVGWAEMESPDEAGQGQVSWAEIETPDEPAQGQVSWAEIETPDVDGQGQVSWTELEVPNPDSSTQISQGYLEVPEQEFPRRTQISWAELEVDDPQPSPRGTIGFAQLEVPDQIDNAAIVSFAELKTPDVNAGGDGDGQIAQAELEVEDPLSLQITRVFVTTPDPKRRGRISWARVEFQSVPKPNRQVKIALKDFNRDLFLDELDIYGIKPDVGLFFPGFDPEEGGTDPQRIWTPKDAASIQFGELVQPGEMWLDYSFELTAEDLFHIQLVCHQHDSSQTTPAQDEEDLFREDLAVLIDYESRCETLTPAEQADCHCRLLRFVLRLATETTVRFIQDKPISSEELD